MHSPVPPGESPHELDDGAVSVVVPPVHPVAAPARAKEEAPLAGGVHTGHQSLFFRQF